MALFTDTIYSATYIGCCAITGSFNSISGTKITDIAVYRDVLQYTGMYCSIQRCITVYEPIVDSI